jgi:gatB/yqey family protein
LESDNVNLFEELKKDMIDAMKAKDKDRLTVIRMLKAALDKERIDKKIEITDEAFISVLEKQVKMRNDSIEEFKKAGREELVEKTLGELEVLKKYLPEALSEDEVMGIINDAITKLEATTMKDMGKVMSEVSPKVKGRYDMKEVSSIIKSKLS